MSRNNHHAGLHIISNKPYGAFDDLYYYNELAKNNRKNDPFYIKAERIKYKKHKKTKNYNDNFIPNTPIKRLIYSKKENKHSSKNIFIQNGITYEEVSFDWYSSNDNNNENIYYCKNEEISHETKVYSTFKSNKTKIPRKKKKSKSTKFKLISIVPKNNLIVLNKKICLFCRNNLKYKKIVDKNKKPAYCYYCINCQKFYLSKDVLNRLYQKSINLNREINWDRVYVIKP